MLLPVAQSRVHFSCNSLALNTVEESQYVLVVSVTV